jgi:hypothetical protein
VNWIQQAQDMVQTMASVNMILDFLKRMRKFISRANTSFSRIILIHDFVITAMSITYVPEAVP